MSEIRHFTGRDVRRGCNDESHATLRGTSLPRSAATPVRRRRFASTPSDVVQKSMMGQRIANVAAERAPIARVRTTRRRRRLRSTAASDDDDGVTLPVSRHLAGSAATERAFGASQATRHRQLLGCCRRCCGGLLNVSLLLLVKPDVLAEKTATVDAVRAFRAVVRPIGLRVESAVRGDV